MIACPTPHMLILLVCAGDTLLLCFLASSEKISQGGADTATTFLFMVAVAPCGSPGRCAGVAHVTADRSLGQYCYGVSCAYVSVCVSDSLGFCSLPPFQFLFQTLVIPQEHSQVLNTDMSDSADP